jgi:hypothetical protein
MRIERRPYDFEIRAEFPNARLFKAWEGGGAFNALGCGAQRAPRVEAGEEVRVSRRRSSVSTILDDETAAGLGCG